jgi:Peptidase family M28
MKPLSVLKLFFLTAVAFAQDEPSVEEKCRQIANLETIYPDLRVSFTDNHPRVVAFRQEIERLRIELRDEFPLEDPCSSPNTIGTTPGGEWLGATAIAIAAPTAVSAEAQPRDARIAAAVAAVSEDELRRSMTTLVSFGTRFAGAPRNAAGERHGVDAARDWIATQFSSFSPRLDVFYDVHPIRRGRLLYNVVAELPGTRFPERRILIVAHYDSMSSESWSDPRTPAPGASDNATGTACILEVARILSGYEFDKTVVFIAFSGEELGLLGSTAYVATLPPTERGIEAVLDNDIVGNVFADDGTRVADRIRIFGTRDADSPARALAHRVVDATARYVPGFAADVIPAVDRSGRGSDHISFQWAGYAAVRLVAVVEMLKNQHNDRDTLEHVSIPYLAQATRVNVAAIAMLATAAAD